MLSLRDFYRLYTIKSYSNTIYSSIVTNLNSLIEYSNRDKEVFVNLKNKTINLFKELNFIQPIQSFELVDIEKVFAIVSAFNLERSFGNSQIAFDLSQILDKNVIFSCNFPNYKNYLENIKFCDFLLDVYLQSDKKRENYKSFIETLQSHTETFTDKSLLYVELYRRKAEAGNH